MKRLAIIPARGGSKRIKNKNIKDFCGKPIINYTINSAMKSNLFDKVHVSTESNLIREVVEKNGISIDFMRPKELSDDFTPLMPVISFVLENYKKMNIQFDEIWVLMACSPLIDENDLISASKIYNSQNNNSIKPLLTVAEYPVPIEWSFLQDKENIMHPRFEGKFKVRSQDLPKSYYDSGSFVIFPDKFISETDEDGTDKGYIGYKLSRYKAIDIDTKEDWDFAEALYTLKFQSNLTP